MRFRRNRILEKNEQGKKGLGLGLVYPSAEAIEIVGMLGGFDFVQLDGEHGLFSPESIDEMCRVADGFGLNVIARVPGIDSSTINSYLDRGVTGIWGPHIETAEEARALVDASLFGPDGQRSWGGGRGNYYNNSALIDIPGGERTEYMRQANANMLVLCQLRERPGIREPGRHSRGRRNRWLCLRTERPGAVHGASGAAGSPRRGCRGAPGGGPHSRRRRQAAHGPHRGHRAATPDRGRGAAVFWPKTPDCTPGDTCGLAR